MPSWFVAFPIEAGDWFRALPPPPSGTKLFAEADLHLTLAFLGEVGAARAQRAFEALDPERIPCCAVRLGRVVPFGSTRRPSALSALVEPRDIEPDAFARWLGPLCDVARAAADLPPEEREMKPHVTLARLRRKASSDERRRALAWAEGCDLDGVDLAIERIGLYSSARDRSARAYDLVAVRPLRSESSG